MSVRVEIVDEIAVSPMPAKILVYEDDKLVHIVTAKIEQEQGGDGGLYPVVKFTEIR